MSVSSVIFPFSFLMNIEYFRHITMHVLDLYLIQPEYVLVAFQMFINLEILSFFFQLLTLLWQLNKLFFLLDSYMYACLYARQYDKIS